MFDISWTEFLLIGVVALIVIGPKELPAVLRTLGQYTRKVRSMAADFQGQFQEAMREAEMADLKKQVDDIATGIKQYDPLKDVRSDVEAAVQSSLEQKPAETASATEPSQTEPTQLAAPAAAEIGQQDAVAAATEVAPEPVEPSVGPATEPNPYSREAAVVAAAIAPVVPESVENAAKPDTAGHGE